MIRQSQGAVFEPMDLAIMRVAVDAVCATISTDACTKESISNFIIEMASCGELDPEILSSGALKKVLWLRKGFGLIKIKARDISYMSPPIQTVRRVRADNALPNFVQVRAHEDFGD
ncbi:MAG: hypothetical protein JWL62_1131 [Hyphomicrobiales bacterium]|nr:hypothetical protein [Hyphomicrobiales bacterium]